MADLMEKIVSLCKRRGFIYQSSEIYGGVESLWDYGPLGALLKNNIRNLWLKKFVQGREDVVLIDGTVLMHPKTWKASGHLESFTDPLIECKKCHSRFRGDELAKKKCPQCGNEELTPTRQFNLLFKTFLGPVEDKAHVTYLRPETAQSMFTDFKLVQESQRLKIPFGIAQMGRCFRNEITTGNFTFRSREFDIAEIEYFVEPGKDEKQFEVWLDNWERFFLGLGLKKENLRRHEHSKKSLSHYSKRTVDIEYKFPFGWAELAGVANRTDYDLKRHSQFSGEDLAYFDEEIKKKYYPYVIEPTMGLERALLAILCDAYTEIKGGRTKTTKAAKEIEVVLKLNKKIAPIKVAVLPLVKNKPELLKKAREVFEILRAHFMVRYDEVGSIGRRYRRQDEIGTLFAVTIDFETLKQEDVTVRDRDTMQQERIKINKLSEFLNKKIR
ncbi:glycine--tRNA ligase [Parcubacteria bacterium DG_74_1]|nr:MAG: glycine--tRNA ligase [Parcubacteria bacterium DG_74_1]